LPTFSGVVPLEMTITTDLTDAGTYARRFTEVDDAPGIVMRTFTCVPWPAVVGPFGEGGVMLDPPPPPPHPATNAPTATMSPMMVKREVCIRASKG
jgi:hypothetical protein